MKCLVLAALLVTAVGSPLPRDCKHEVLKYGGMELNGPLHMGHNVSSPVIHRVEAVSVNQYQPAYPIGTLPAGILYNVAPGSSLSRALPQPTHHTPEVHTATAAFMAAWNEASARATQIQTTLVRSAPSGTYTIEIPKQVEAAKEVKRATVQFMEAWNKAARCAAIVEQAVYSLPQSVEETAALQKKTAEFMTSWEAAAQHASAIRHAMTATTYSGVPQQVEATVEVKRATEGFMAAWRNAVSRVSTMQTHLYQITGTTPYSSAPIIVDGIPQFTPEVALATAEFMKEWNAAVAAAAAAVDVNIIMGASSQLSSLQATNTFHLGATSSQSLYPYAPATVEYNLVSPPALPQPNHLTPEVHTATAAFMAAWNEASARATQIQTTLVRSAPSGTYTIEIPKQVEATEEVKRATTQFITAWNKAAQCVTVVEQAVKSSQQSVEQTTALQKTTAEFMASWEAAAQQASAISHVVTATTYSGVPQQVEATAEVKRATEGFMAAWRNAVSRVSTMQTHLYQITGTTPYSSAPIIVDGVPQFTPEVAHATAEFTKVWNSATAAAAAAAATLGANIIKETSSQLSSLQATNTSHVAASSSQSSYLYNPTYPPALPQSTHHTPEVHTATAAFMAAWNEASARATQIQTTLVRSAPSGTYTIEIPKQVEATEEVKRATTQFMAAWNKAAQYVTVVEQAVNFSQQSVEQTTALKKTTAEFMASWEAAAQQASAISHVVTATTYSGVPQQVEATAEVKRATEGFMAAWRNAVSRVSTMQTHLYQITGTTPYSSAPIIVDGVPQFTPEVAHATAEFTKVWNSATAAAAAAAATLGANIIKETSSQLSSLQATNTSHVAASSSQSSYLYNPTYPPALPQSTHHTPEVHTATAAFMAAWNEASARATQIQTTLVRSAPSGTYTIEIPKQVEATEEVKRATTQFMAAWNKAAQCVTVVQQAVNFLQQSVEQTTALKKTTAEFMASWEAAAQQASAISHVVTATTYSGVPQQVEATAEVKRATEGFMAAWRNAVSQVSTMQTHLYQITGTTPYSSAPIIVDGVPQFTPEVAHATAEFTKVWNSATAAAAAAAATLGANIIKETSSQLSSLQATNTSHVAASSSQSSYLYNPTYPPALPQSTHHTPEVHTATAAFMAAWNEASARATQIQTTLVRSAPSGTYTIEIPKHVEATEEVKRATTQFMAAWNKAAQCVTVVEQAVNFSQQSVEQTTALKKTTAEFMASWQAAAQQASAISHVVTATTYSGVPQQVEATAEVKRATEGFMAAWRNAVSQVSTMQTHLYQITGTTPYSSAPIIVDGVPQFTPEVAHATAEFTKVWNSATAAAAAAAATLGANIIKETSSQLSSLQATNTSHVAASSSQSSYLYNPTYPPALPQSTHHTPEVHTATAAFMAAWNEASARATQIQTTLVRSAPSGTYTIEIPKQVEATEEVKRATTQFMAAWNKAAQCVTVVEQAVNFSQQSVEQTTALKKTTAEFMASWEAAAQQASAISHVVTATTYSGVPQQVEATAEVKRATEGFMAAWRNAVSRVSTMQTHLYQITGTTPYSSAPIIVDGVPQFTPEVAHATAEFTKVWNSATAAAAATLVANIIKETSSQLSSLQATNTSHVAASSSQSSYLYNPTYPPALPQSTHHTPEVHTATAAFMAAWNEASARATQIQTTLVRSAPSGTYTIEIPKQVEATEEVKRATTQFMAAWNKAAQCVTVVEQAVNFSQQSVEQTTALKKTTAEFIASWEAAAQQASAISHVVTATTYSGVPQQVEATAEVKRATEGFMAAWRNAVSRVSTMQTHLYQITGTTPYSSAPIIVDGVPQFTPEVAHATAEFTKVWNSATAAAAAAAATLGANIIKETSSQLSSLQATNTSHVAASSSQSSYLYNPTYPPALPQSTHHTPEVHTATAAFMAAWNEASARATQIQRTLVRSAPSGTYTIEIPKQVEATEEVKRATTQFMAAWNKAAQCVTVVEQAVNFSQQSVEQTTALKKTTAEFMASWEAAAQQASAISHVVTATTYSGVPQQVEATAEVKRATEGFMAAWRNAVSRVSTMQTHLYQITGTTPYSSAPIIVDGVPQFTPEVAHATAEFTKVWNSATAAAAAAAATLGANIIMETSSQLSSLQATNTSHVAASSSQSSYLYNPTYPPALPQSTHHTPEVHTATAAFMAAWNEASARATQIQTTLVRSAPSGTYTIEIPKQVEATEEVKRATTQFMAAWNKAAQCVTVVEQAVNFSQQSVEQTTALKKTTAEFMASWQAAAQQASAISHVVTATTYSGVPQQVEATAEVKRATEGFIAAWRNAVSQVSTMQTHLYQITGTTPYSSAPIIVDGVPQFTPEVAHATAEFTKVWNSATAAAAAAAATLGANIIKETSSQLSSLQATNTSHVAASSSQSSYLYNPTYPPALPQSTHHTPEVHTATAAFMAAWNEASARATQIQTTLVRSAPSGTYTIEIPKQVEATEEVKRATTQFMAAWNKAAQCVTVVEQAVNFSQQSVEQTTALKKTTAEFIASWEAAAQQASAISHVVTATTYSGVPQQVEATAEVKRATEGFMAAWRNAVSRVSTMQTHLYQITGTTPYSSAPIIVDGVPQFTPEVAHATAEFTKVWNSATAAAAAAAATLGANIIKETSSQLSSLQATNTSHVAASSSQSSYLYNPTYPPALPQSTHHTPEVHTATAAFMAAWNEASARATQIQTTLVRSAPSGTYTIEIPKQVEATEEVKRATTQFMAAWNKAAQCVTVVEQAVNFSQQSVEQTTALKKTTAEFIASWEAAAQQASAISHVVTATTYSGVPQQVEATAEVKRATEGFMAAWRNAVSRVSTMQTHLYQITGTTPYSSAPIIVDGVPQFTPEVAHATAEFTKVWNSATAAAAAAAATLGANIIKETSSQLSSLQATNTSHVAASSSQSSYLYNPTYPPALPQSTHHTPEVHTATAAFMAAWNEASARATQIQRTLVRSAPSGTYTIEIPKQVEATEEVKRATTQFMAAWNKAAQCVTVVEQAVNFSQQSVEQTTALKKTTAEFMASWEAAAQQASAISHVVTATTYSGVPQQVEATAEVKRATEGFMAAWRNAVSRVSTMQTHLYQITGTTPYSSAPIIVDGVPQFTPEVAHATAEFTKVWNSATAAAAATLGANIIKETSSQLSSLQATNTSHVAASSSQSSYLYNPTYPPALPQSTHHTPEVHTATAAFMAAWNEASARATQIQRTLVRSAPSGTYTIEIPKQVEATEEVKRATTQFMAAWNKAAQCVTVVEQAVNFSQQSVEQTTALKKTTAEFMASWEAAAQQASAISHVVIATTYSGVPQQVEATAEVKRATEGFMAAWRNAVSRVSTMQTHLYQITGTTPYSSAPIIVDGVPQFTPEVAHATAEFTKVWNSATAAAAAAAATLGANIIMETSSQLSSLQATNTSHVAASSSQSSYLYNPTYPPALPQSTHHTPEVHTATAAFMAAWNEASARATQIQRTLVRSAPSGTYTIEIPKQVEATEEVKRATTQFMAAWNKAAQCVTVVEQAVNFSQQSVEQTTALKKTTAEFMASWEAAAQQASAISHVVTATTYSGVPQQVEATAEVKRATEGFMAAWRNAVSRVSTMQTHLYQITGTTPYSSAPIIVDGVPQFTPEVAHATAEFTKVWNSATAAAAAAAATLGANIIKETSSQLSSLQATNTSHVAASSSQSSYLYNPTYPPALPQSTHHTPEVHTATAAFMAAWNEASARATQIQTTLVRSAPSGTYTIEIPNQVEATEEVKRATTQFMAAWNKAARRATVVEQTVNSLQQSVEQTAALQKTTHEFLTSWEDAAEHASGIRHAVTATTYSGVPQQVEATAEVKRATEGFMAAWRNAVSRVSTMQTHLYQITGTTPYSSAPIIVDGVPQFTPEVAHATAEFMKVWNSAAAAAAAAAATLGANIIMGASSQH